MAGLSRRGSEQSYTSHVARKSPNPFHPQASSHEDEEQVFCHAVS